VKNINCKTYKKGDKGHWRDVGPIEALKKNDGMYLFESPLTKYLH
jgi:hypothetical protein